MKKRLFRSDGLETAVAEKLEQVRAGLYEKALANRKAHTYDCTSIDEIKQKLSENGDGFVRAMWCGDPDCEDRVKELTEVGSRCIPFEQVQLSDKCVAAANRKAFGLLGKGILSFCFVISYSLNNTLLPEIG